MNLNIHHTDCDAYQSWIAGEPLGEYGCSGGCAKDLEDYNLVPTRDDLVWVNVNEDGEEYAWSSTVDLAIEMLEKYPNDSIVLRRQSRFFPPGIVQASERT